MTTTDDLFRALTPGCCTREKAAECATCRAKYAAIDALKAEVERLRKENGDMRRRLSRARSGTGRALYGGPPDEEEIV